MSEEEILARAGLESINPEAEGLCPEFQREGDRIWATVVRRGLRVKLFEISVVRAMLLNKQLAETIWALAPR